MKSRFVSALVLLVSSVSTAAISQTTETSTPTTDATAAVQEETGAPAPSSDAQQGELVATTPAAEAAADASAESAGGIEDIVVTATRREERLQDVPVAVTAITSSTLATAGVGGLRDLTVVVPGFQGGRNATVNQPTIRGVGSSGVGMADESNVATYVDGVYQPFSFTSALDLVEIERVEVLRGPQGTVFGRNATGGLINVITPDPSFNTRGRIEARVGRMRNDATEIDLRTYLTAGLTDTIAMDFAGLYKKNDGYIKDLVRGGNLGDSRSINLRSKLLFQPNDDVRIVLTGNYAELDSSQNTVIPYKNNTAGRRYAGYIRPTNPWEASLTDVPQSNYDRVSVALQTQFDLGGMSLQTTSSYIQNDIRQFTDSDASNIFLGQIPFDASGESYSQEVRLLSTGPGRFKWILGAYAFHLDAQFDDIQLQNSTPGNPVTIRRLDPHAKTTSFAGFGEGTLEMVDNLFLTAGVRYTTEKRKFGTAMNLVPLPFGTAERTSNKWTYRAALRYNFSDRGNVYVSYGTGFKSGVFNELGTSNIATDPETIRAWEGGIKVDPLPWLRTNLSIYHYDYKDLQVQARSGDSYILQNAANAEIYGGELEVTAAVTDNLNLRAAYTYTHGEYVDFTNAQAFVPRVDGGNTQETRDVSGNKIIRAPRHTISGGFDWGHDLAGGRFNATANVFHSARVYYDFLNLASQKPYTTASSEISWTTPSEAWRFSLWAKNITNEAIAQTLRPGVLGTDAIYDRPREIGIGATFRF
ncbi:MAG: hypothetical protein JWN69_1482 [Alphaproteobacteria bacterium]|nr:hypothetical protein [Alphaproteobacteria bacterium]